VTITIPTWLLWVVGVPVAIVLAFCLICGLIVVFGKWEVWR